uniref:4-coumarate--CoA ligase n=1 Tax=Ananas comosus var. bracteatus TaxID=296719 RepID=A0A6V7NQY7_ANACO|nr:unnamed protein product [Ananas comosus var. bracteatus]
MANKEGLTLTGLLKEAAEKFPGRRALLVPGKLDLTHAQLHDLVESAAAAIAAAGVRPGDVVALTFPNTVEYVIMFLAVIRARAVAAPLNSAYTAEEFEFYLSDSESTLLLTNAEGNAAAEAAASKLGIPAPPPRSPTRPGRRPKGVPLTQLNLAASVSNIRSVYRLSESDATVVVLPLFHVHGLVAALLSSLAAGGAAALPAAGRFSASAFWGEMRAAGATWYTAVPTVHQILLDRHAARPEPEGGYPRLRFVRSCSASLAPAVLARLEAALGAPVLEAYAMTEAAHLMTSNPLPEDGAHKPGSVGRAVGQELAVLDEEGNPRPPHAPGEVCVRGPNVTGGYKNNPAANREAFRHGWFHTGDVGFLDDDGYLRLVGRIKELINRGGEKISPIEVDAVLLAHPNIAQAVAFGVPDDKYGEEINCAVIPREGAEIGAEEVVSYCRKNLAAFKVPKKVYITDSLPKTATGKIQRRLLAEHFLAPAEAIAAGHTVVAIMIGN